jgi:hypothetical protein
VSDRLKILNESTELEPNLSVLRERAASALELALAFVGSYGNELSRCRARILVELDPVERGLALLSSQQVDDGFFPVNGQVIAAPYSDALLGWDPHGSIAGTLEAISVLSDWRRLYESCADRAIDFLGKVQRSDGSWGSGESTPGDDQPMALFATGCLAGFLGRTRSARPEMLRAAGAYMGGFWSVETIRSQGWPAVAGFAHYFTNVHDEEAEAALPWCARELERGNLVGDYSAVDVLRVLSWCEASALPGVTFDTNLLLGDVLNEQLEDGSIGRADVSSESRVASTLDAMSFLIRLCRGSMGSD